MKNGYFKYLDVSALEQKWGTYVTTVGFARVAPFEHYPNAAHPQSHDLSWSRWRKLDEYHLVYIAKGKGIFESEGTAQRTVEEGCCLFLFPGVHHRYKPDAETGWEEYWFGFKGYYIDQLMSSGLFDADVPCVQVGLQKDVPLLFRQAIESVQAGYAGYPQQVAGTLLQMLGLIHTAMLQEAGIDDQTEKLVQKAKFLMEDNLHIDLDMEWLARELPMSYSRFRKAFKSVTGESPHQYLLSRRLDRAKMLLSTTAMNVSEIAGQTGFESIYYFSRLFKKKHGVSPLLFRKCGDIMEYS